MKPRIKVWVGRYLIRLALVIALQAACAPSQSEAPPRHVLIVGIDVSGSFRPWYNDAIDFAAYYIYGRLNGLGGLRVPTTMFVTGVGGRHAGEMKPFHPIHDFEGKSVEEIAADLREWFPIRDSYTDFNPFFDRTATHVKRQNLILTPLDIVLISDGLPDTPARGDTLGPYQSISLAPLEFLSRSTTVRLLYPTPTIAVRWERAVDRRRVKLWTQDEQVMAGWRKQLVPDQPPEAQDNLWRWVADIVDFRVRARIL